jgi:hypothetical protein
VAGLATVLKSGGRLFLMCFSDQEPGTQGPRRISQKICFRGIEKPVEWHSLVPLAVGLKATQLGALVLVLFTATPRADSGDVTPMAPDEPTKFGPLARRDMSP